MYTNVASVYLPTSGSLRTTALRKMQLHPLHRNACISINIFLFDKYIIIYYIIVLYCYILYIYYYFTNILFYDKYIII